MRFSSLPQWLEWQEKLHFTEIDPGLDRIGAVWRNMGGDSRLPFRVVTVAGTNGKGSSVALCSAILQASGYRTATYTSPHLLRYNERICIAGQPCSDAQICEAFARIDAARGEVSLTYFEFATLAAVDIFSRENVEVAVLEVGMGGRLDAVNLFDCDVALITPIALDHTQWLGDTRDCIGREKAGIIRQGKPLVLSETQPPGSVTEQARRLGVPTYIAGRDFSYTVEGRSWRWHNRQQQHEALPMPALAGRYQLQNAAAVLQVCALLAQQGMEIDAAAIRQGLLEVKLAGRFQLIPGPVTRILDVTHNQQGAQNLHTLLRELPCSGRTFAVLAMLRDKDAAAVAAELAGDIDLWYLAGLEGSRSLPAAELAAMVTPVVGLERVRTVEQVAAACRAAMAEAKSGDRILIFGSFHTVEAAMRLLPDEGESGETVAAL